MSQLNDEYFRVLGRGSVNNRLLEYYQNNGATSEDINDAEMEFLEAQTLTTGNVNDLWFSFLQASLYTGTLDEMKLAYWMTQPDFAIEVVTFLGVDVTFNSKLVTHPA